LTEYRWLSPPTIKEIFTMAKRLENSFQFLDVPRFDPAKKDIATRSTEFVEI